MEKYSKVELLALVKVFNKQNDEKIKNTDKMKKNEILEICRKNNILPNVSSTEIKVALNTVSKTDLKKDIEIHFLKHGKPIPQDILNMKKRELIEYMEMHNIVHYTSDLIKQETEKYQHLQLMKTIVVYNIMKYDSIDVSLLTDDNLEKYIIDNDLDCDIEDIQQYSILLTKLYAAYEDFCKVKNLDVAADKIRSFPKILRKLNDIVSR